MQDKATLSRWLADGEIDRVVDTLQHMAEKLDDKYFSKEVIHQAGRFNSLQKDRNQGLLEGAHSYHERLDAIRLALQDLIEKIPNERTQTHLPKERESKSNAIEIDPASVEKSSLILDPTPAHATAKTQALIDPGSTDSILSEIKNPCILSIEKNLRTMANQYFDENGFERPTAPSALYVQSYLTLQGAELKKIEESLRTASVGKKDFFQRIKLLSKDLKNRCDQVGNLLDQKNCMDFPIRSSLHKTVLSLKLLEQTLPNLITDRKIETKDKLMSDYIIPLANQIGLLSDKMINFDREQITIVDN